MSLIPEADRARLFPALAEGRLFLNHAGVSPISGPAAEALTGYVRTSTLRGSAAYDEWGPALEAVRDRVAAALGATAGEIAFVANTTAAIATVANGLPFSPGERVIGFAGDYPANVYPWSRLSAAGVSYEVLPAPDGRPDLEALERALDERVRLVAVSWVSFWSGARAPLGDLVRLAHGVGARVLVDAVQGLGALTLDVKEQGIDFLACGAHKWLLSPEGIGFLYLDRAELDRVAVTAPGAWSMHPPFPYLDHHGRLHPDAARFENGTKPTGNILALGATLELMQRLGPAALERAVLENARILGDGLRERGWRLVGVAPGATPASGMAADPPPGTQVVEVVRRLARADIVATEREGHLRLSPHFYQAPDEMRRVIAALP